MDGATSNTEACPFMCFRGLYNICDFLGDIVTCFNTHFVLVYVVISVLTFFQDIYGFFFSAGPS